MILSAMLLACDRIYINGDLDGMWQLQKVENSDTTIYPKDIYYSFQRNLTFVSRMNEKDWPVRYLGNLHYEMGKSITLDGFRHFPEEQYPATTAELEKCMIFGTEVRFDIEHIDNSVLVMDNNGYRYTLRKW